ncbi:MAG: M28 family peptidase [Halieaceae bacterium]|nr:M28 family peptidase [Halieaceae bacterium]
MRAGPRILKTERALQRSVVFALWTGEESGLLVYTAYSARPIYPLQSKVANLTLAMLLTAGPARDVILVGSSRRSAKVPMHFASGSSPNLAPVPARPDPI